MLIENNNIVANSVVSIKLSNGDEIVARFLKETDSHVVVDRPLLAVVTQHPSTGAPAIQMMPLWALTADDKNGIEINKNTIIFKVLSSKEAATNHSNITSPIARPNSGLIV